jgi:carbamoyl-phosphate synthase large subunit
MKYNILVTGTGAIIGYGIIESLRKSSFDVHIVAIDIYDYAYGQYLADKFYQGVPAINEKYIHFINDIVKKENIHLIIPGIEQDLYMLYQHKEVIQCPIVMNNKLCIELSKSKLKTFQYFKSHSDIDLIPTLHDVGYEACVEQLGSPFLLKPISSYASKGIEKIKTNYDFDYYTKMIDNKCVFQKIISSIDDEFTISIFGDGKGGYFDHIILKRYLSQEGATSRAMVVESKIIMDYINKIIVLLKPIGPTNIQIRIENDNPLLLEINPRISSACSIRTIFNYNEPEMCLKYYLSKDKIVPSVKKKGSVLRYICDYLVYE